jgi:hypothetical protein
MHFLLGAAGLLALIAMAFGEGAAVRVAQVIVVVGAAIALWLAVMIVGGRL